MGAYIMTMVNGYEQSDREEKIDILNLESLEERAEKIIPTGGFGYISGGSEDEWTLRQNRTAFQHRQIAPKALSGIEKPELNTEIFGNSIEYSSNDGASCSSRFSTFTR